MKRVGVIGDIGPESTIKYYRLPIRAYRAGASEAARKLGLKRLGLFGTRFTMRHPVSGHRADARPGRGRTGLVVSSSGAQFLFGLVVRHPACTQKRRLSATLKPVSRRHE
jgi:hypothetical protein